MLKALLQHPRTRGFDIDDPQTTMLRRMTRFAARWIKFI